MPDLLKTARFLLRKPVVADGNWIPDSVRMPEIYENVAAIPPEISHDEIETFVREKEEGRQADTDYVFVVEKDDQSVGLIGLHRTSRSDPFELGYWFRPEAWGEGIATEAAKALIDWWKDYKAPRFMISGHFSDNPASGKVLQKLGFLPCWRSDVFCKGRGEPVDHVYMSLMAE